MRKTGPLCPSQLHPFTGTKSPLTSPALSLCDEALQRASRPGQARELYLHLLPLLTMQSLPNAVSVSSLTELKLPSDSSDPPRTAESPLSAFLPTVLHNPVNKFDYFILPLRISPLPTGQNSNGRALHPPPTQLCPYPATFQTHSLLSLMSFHDLIPLIIPPTWKIFVDLLLILQNPACKGSLSHSQLCAHTYLLISPLSQSKNVFELIHKRSGLYRRP